MYQLSEKHLTEISGGSGQISAAENNLLSKLDASPDGFSFDVNAVVSRVFPSYSIYETYVTTPVANFGSEADINATALEARIVLADIASTPDVNLTAALQDLINEETYNHETVSQIDASVVLGNYELTLSALIGDSFNLRITDAGTDENVIGFTIGSNIQSEDFIQTITQYAGDGVGPYDDDDIVYQGLVDNNQVPYGLANWFSELGSIFQPSA